MSTVGRARWVRTTIYVTRDCPYCAAKRRELDARGVPYDVVDLSVQPEAVPELLKLTGGERRVPVVVEGGRISVARDGGSPF